MKCEFSDNTPRETGGRSTFDPEQEKLFTERLWQEDETAWQVIYEKTVLPILRSSTRNGISFYRIMKERGLSETDVFGMLYEDMLCRKRLANFRFGCPVIYWMRTYVSKLLLEYCKKNPNPVSDFDRDELSPYEANNERWSLIQDSFAELWRKNPMKAYIYLLKRYYNTSSDQIREMLGVSSNANVDQQFSRANKEMLQLLKENSGGAL